MKGLTERSLSINTMLLEVSWHLERKKIPVAVTVALSECEHLFLARYCQGVYN